MSAQSKERPILFSAPMARAILAGSKTQTRRVVKPAPPAGELRTGFTVESTCKRDEGTFTWRAHFDSVADAGPVLHRLRCPYGRVGDRLWVKERWRPRITHVHGQNACDCADVNVTYRADEALAFYVDARIPSDWTMPKAAARGDVTPLFMPRWASRITLEVTGVRVERLQAISDDDAIDEGIERGDFRGKLMHWRNYLSDSPVDWCASARNSFRTLWSSINGAESWDANPWVWVVEFKRVEAQR